MTHVLILSSDARAETVRKWQGAARKSSYAYHDSESDHYAVLANATLVPIPDEWADIQPASPLPWAGHDLRDDEGQVQDANLRGVAGRRFEVCARDAFYIAVSCNDRPAMLVKLAEQEAEIYRIDEEATCGALDSLGHRVRIAIALALPEGSPVDDLVGAIAILRAAIARVEAVRVSLESASSATMPMDSAWNQGVRAGMARAAQDLTAALKGES